MGNKRNMFSTVYRNVTYGYKIETHGVSPRNILTDIVDDMVYTVWDIPTEYIRRYTVDNIYTVGLVLVYTVEDKCYNRGYTVGHIPCVICMCG